MNPSISTTVTMALLGEQIWTTCKGGQHRVGTGSQTWGRILAKPFTGCPTTTKLFTLSRPQLPHL